MKNVANVLCFICYLRLLVQFLFAEFNACFCCRFVWFAVTQTEPQILRAAAAAAAAAACATTHRCIFMW